MRVQVLWMSGLAIVVSVALFSARDGEALNPEIQMQFDLAIDTDVAGNSTSQLGDLNPCVSVNPGETFDVDLVVQGIGAPGVAGLAADILYDPAILKVVDKDIDSFMLGIGGTALAFSDVPPDTDGDLRIDDVNITLTYASGDGVIERLTFEAISSGGSTLTWDDFDDGIPDVVYLDMSDPDNPDWVGFFPNMRARGAEVVVGTPCPGNLLDGDGDGYSDVHEDSVETLVVQACPSTATANDEFDSWPPDFDDNQKVDIIDVLAFKPVFTGPSARHDLNASGGNIDIIDVLAMKPVFGAACTP